MRLFLKNTALGTALLLLPGMALWGQTDGKGLYLDKCATCHGQDGMGKTSMGKKLKVVDVKSSSAKTSAAEMERVVTNGNGHDMDAFGKDLSSDQIKAIVAYYRGLAK